MSSSSLNYWVAQFYYLSPQNYVSSGTANHRTRRMRKWSEFPGCSLTNWADTVGFFWGMRRLRSIPAGPLHCSSHQDSRHSPMSHPRIQCLTVLNCSLICHFPEPNVCVVSVSVLTLSQTLFLTWSFSDWTCLGSLWGPGLFRHHGLVRFRIDPFLCFRQIDKLASENFSLSASLLSFARLFASFPDAEITLFVGWCSQICTRGEDCWATVRGVLPADRRALSSRVACVTAWEKLKTGFRVLGRTSVCSPGRIRQPGSRDSHNTFSRHHNSHCKSEN